MSKTSRSSLDRLRLTLRAQPRSAKQDNIPDGRKRRYEQLLAKYLKIINEGTEPLN